MNMIARKINHNVKFVGQLLVTMALLKTMDANDLQSTVTEI